MRWDRSVVQVEISAEALVTSVAASLMLPIVAPTLSTTASAAVAISPTSSLRPTSGIVTVKLPAATSSSGTISARNGRAIEDALNTAEANKENHRRAKTDGQLLGNATAAAAAPAASASLSRAELLKRSSRRVALSETGSSRSS